MKGCLKFFLRRKRSIIVRTIVSLFAFSALMSTGLLLIVYKIIQRVVHPPKSTYELSYREQVEHETFDSMWFRNLDKEAFHIRTINKNRLNGYYIYGKNRNEYQPKVVILIHGIGCSLWTSMKYVDLFRTRGYDVIAYDQPNHGYSEGEVTTMGILESLDLKSVIDYVKDRYEDKAIIGLHGESMGAGTAMLALGLSDDIDFIIEDCGYSRIEDEMFFRLKHDYHLPRFPLMYMARSLVQFLYHVDLFERHPIDAVANSSCPLLILHGLADTYVPTYMAKEIYDAREGNKQMFLFEGSGHAKCIIDYPEDYKKAVDGFLETYGF